LVTSDDAIQLYAIDLLGAELILRRKEGH